MVEGYKSSADYLVDRALDDRHDAKALIFPIVFLYRHYLEIQLKYIISTYGDHLDVSAVWNTHDLGLLRQRFMDVLNEFGVDDSDHTDLSVKVIVGQFAKIDPGSFSHRYPFDTKGRKIPIPQDKFDFETLEDVMDGVYGYFSGCDGYLSDLESAGPDYEYDM